MKGESGDFKITPDEFKEYYSNISASIDNDAYFAQMMNNAWNLDGNADAYKKYGKGWSGEDPVNPKCYQYENNDIK